MFFQTFVEDLNEVFIVVLGVSEFGKLLVARHFNFGDKGLLDIDH